MEFAIFLLGIFNLNPIVNHPIKLAERVAMLDHMSKGRFEFGTGRGAGSHEIGDFGLDPSDTKANWDEAIWELTCPGPRNSTNTGHERPGARHPGIEELPI